MRLDRKDLETLARVHAGNRDFVELLKARLQKHHVDVVMQKDEVPLRWAQGRAHELSELITALETAAASL